MLAAHIKSMTLLATPFRSSTLQPFAFGPGTQWQEITREIREQIPVMLKERLTPPPRETYSLNRYALRSYPSLGSPPLQFVAGLVLTYSFYAGIDRNAGN